VDFPGAVGVRDPVYACRVYALGSVDTPSVVNAWESVCAVRGVCTCRGGAERTANLQIREDGTVDVLHEFCR
jgi:hypothetical protein